MLMYKFFFFNYIFQVTGSDILDALVQGEPDNPLEQYSKDFPPIARPHDIATPLASPTA